MGTELSQQDGPFAVKLKVYHLLSKVYNDLMFQVISIDETLKGHCYLNTKTLRA